MSAEDHLGRQFFHGTHAELKPGDWLSPAAVTGYQSRFADHDYYDSRYTYLSDQAHLAGRYAYRSAQHHGGQPHVYQVRATNPLPDPERESGFGTDQWVSHGGEIEKEVPKSDWWDERRAKLAGF